MIIKDVTICPMKDSICGQFLRVLAVSGGMIICSQTKGTGTDPNAAKQWAMHFRISLPDENAEAFIRSYGFELTDCRLLEIQESQITP